MKKFEIAFASSAAVFHRLGMASTARKIREMRKRAGLTQAEFAEKIGIAQGTVSKWESGKEVPRFESLQRISESLGESLVDLIFDAEHGFKSTDDYGGVSAMVVGAVQAGAWVEAVEWEADDQFRVMLPERRELEDLPLFGFLVRGQSMNEIFPDGSIVVAIRSYEKYPPRDGDFVVVERIRHDAMVEATIKEYQLDKAGSPWLWPRSDSPEHQSPINLASDDGEIAEIRIIGIVLASVRFEHIIPGRFKPSEA